MQIQTRKCGALCVLLLSYLLPLTAQNQFQVLSSTSGAASYALAQQNGFLYSGEGNTLSIYDVRQGNLPPYNRLFRHRFRSFIDDLIVEGNVLYVCANSDGLYTYDISIPSQPSLLASWQPPVLNEAVYDVAVFGDTVFLANKSKLTVLRRNGDVYTRITDLSILTNANSRVRGCAIKDGLLAFTIATMSIFPSVQDGIYIYDASTLTQLSFHQEFYGDAEDVLFGQETALLHVMGGGQFTSSLPFPFSDPRGHYYILDISDPSAPLDVFHDTIAGITGLGDTQLFDAALRNDTIYIATRTGDDQIFPVDGNVFVYDVRHADSISLIADISAGLLHFDVCLQGSLMHVASEWFGIRTIDIQDVLQPIDIGDTRTGGWCAETDIHGNLMVQANEGYGTQLFDISDRRNPTLIGFHDNIGQGFNFNARFSADGDYVFATYLEGATLNEFRVLRTSTMEEVGALNFFAGYNHCFVHDDRFVSYAERIIGQSYITLLNVENPLIPQLITTKNMTVEDMDISEDGFLWVCREDSLLVYALENSFVLKDAISADGDAFHRVAPLRNAARNDAAIYRNSGLYVFGYNAQSEEIEEIRFIGNLQNGIPTHMAMDTNAIYCGYTEYGLFAVDHESGEVDGYYRTGLDFIFPQWWPLENVQVFDDLVVITEYFGQTTLLTFGDTTTSINTSLLDTKNVFELFPNPASTSFRILNHSNESFYLEIFTVSGECIDRQLLSGIQNSVSLEVPNGIYVVLLTQDDGYVQYEKLIVTR